MQKKNQIFRLIVSCTKKSYLDSKVLQNNSDCRTCQLAAWKKFISDMRYLIQFLYFTLSFPGCTSALQAILDLQGL